MDEHSCSQSESDDGGTKDIWRGKVINVSVGRDSNGLIGTNSFVYSSDGALTFYGCVDVLNRGSTLDLGSLRSWPR